ncbi:winged helix-turn-helix transcriptional regulator [Streptomyces roseirectus]|uniref:Winged helix-turn-helix transcriptional regulator n=1 Tax=Streptomyces roseirectus TaxID=2768066 RepID=A0A7H0IN61_9ACTN|nr:winged helix-turn-helix transcriptional regulator [Streptomyces roseirectus]
MADRPPHPRPAPRPRQHPRPLRSPRPHPLLRRPQLTPTRAGGADAGGATPVLRWGDGGARGRVAVDRQAHRVFKDGTEVALSPKEYALLEYLSRQTGALVTRESIMAAVWDSDWFGSTKTLDTHVTSLRHELGDALCIEAVRGVGFRLVIGRDGPAEVGPGACPEPRPPAGT